MNVEAIARDIVLELGKEAFFWFVKNIFNLFFSFTLFKELNYSETAYEVLPQLL